MSLSSVTQVIMCTALFTQSHIHTILSHWPVVITGQFRQTAQ